MQGHYLLGLKILNMLVTEFNQPTSGRTMTQHRKLAVAFRDGALLKVFQIAVTALQLLASNASADDKLREQVSRGPSCHGRGHTNAGCEWPVRHRPWNASDREAEAATVFGQLQPACPGWFCAAGHACWTGW